jgi:hypothetical protein
MNKKIKKTIKRFVYSLCNILDKRYVVKYEDDNKNGSILETYNLNFQNKDKIYLKNQKLITQINEDKVNQQLVFEYESVILDIFTGVFLNSSNYYIKKSSLKYPSLVPYTFLSKIGTIDNSFLRSQKYFFLTSTNSAYYHQWFDGLIYLYFLSKTEEKYLVIVPNSCPDKIKDLLLNFKNELEIKYVSERFINIPKIIRFPHISWAKHAPIITEDIAYFFKSKILKNKPDIKTYRKIYIGRKKSATRNIKNNNEITCLFKDNNFEIVYLEKYSIQEQAYLFNNAKEIAGLHGAGFTNLIFCEAGTKIIELQNLVNVTTYFMISQQLDLDYYYILPNEFDFEKIKDPYKEDVSFLKQKLSDTSYNLEKINLALNKINNDQ